MNMVMERPAVGDTMPILRIRSELFRARLAEKGYSSIAAFLRHIDLSANAWRNVMKEGREEYNTRVLAVMMQELGISASEAFELLTDEELARRSACDASEPPVQ